VGWVFTAQLLVAGIVTLLVGAIVSRTGQRDAYLGAAGIYVLGAIACALAPTVETLVAGRALQAVGGGCFYPLAAGILAQRFTEHRARVLGLLSTFYPLGGIIGPNVGGFITANAGWRGVFLISIPVTISGALLVLALLERDRPTRAAAAVDLPGIALLCTGMLSFMLGLTNAAAPGAEPLAPQVGGLLVLGAALLATLFWWEGRARNPVLDLELLRRQPFIAVNILGFGIASCIFAGFSLVPLYVSVVYGFGASVIGLMLTPRAVANVLLSIVCSFGLRRTGFRIPLWFGLSAVAVGYVTLAYRPPEPSWLGIPMEAWLGIQILLGGFGMGFVLPSANSAGIDAAPEKATAISGMRGAFNTVGNIMGTSVGLMLVSRAPDQGTGISWVFVASSVGIVALILFVVPFMPARPRANEPMP